MKLLTHNFLACNIKGIKRGYPLIIEASSVETRDADFDPDFIRKMMQRVDYKALKQAAEQMGVKGLPEDVEESHLEDLQLLQLLHHAMLEIHLEEGSLTCPESGRKFPVSCGIPNMLLHEDEV